MKKAFGVHHTHPSHPVVLVIVEDGKVKEVAQKNSNGVVWVADLDLLKGMTPDERVTAVTMGVHSRPLPHEKFEKFLDSLIEPEPPAPPIAAEVAATPPVFSPADSPVPVTATSTPAVTSTASAEVVPAATPDPVAPASPPSP